MSNSAYKNRSRRQNKRYETKKFRQAEKTIIQGGRSGDPYIGHVKTNDLPVMDGPVTGKTTKKKVRKPKEKCPVNRTHEWYVEDIFSTEVSFYPLFADFVTKKVERTYLKRKATCIHCWKEKWIRRRSRHYWRPVKTKVTEIAPRPRPFYRYYR